MFVRKMDKCIYLDNAATTATYPEAAKVAYEYSTQLYFNPSALYKQSVDISVQLRRAREHICKVLHAPDGELYFLSGGTEADNTALFCTRKPKGSRIIVGLGEHDAIINSANELKMQGYDVQFAPINTDGSINVSEFEKLLNEKVSLVSIMHVSNETGAINDIAKLVRLTKKHSPSAVFHSDGVQAFEKIPVNLSALGVDLYTISGHKIHAPKGIGGLFVRKGVSIRPLIYGGGQERGFRSGTENTACIMAFDKAVVLNEEDFAANYSIKAQIKEYLLQKILDNFDDTVIISPKDGAPHILTVAFAQVRGEVLLHALEKHGIIVGIGSACSSHHESRFKGLLGLDNKHNEGIVRFSFSQYTTKEDIDRTVEALNCELKLLQSYGRV